MSQAHLPFPAAEGAGIFIGVVAWDVLTVGELELVKASLIALVGALLWHGARCWLASNRRKRIP